MDIVDLLFRMLSKSPDQILQGPEGELKVKAVHEQLQRQAFWQSSFVGAEYDEAESSGNVAAESVNSSVLPFCVLQFNGLCRT
ncbi:hypothetical protein SUGI_0543540 [Cryptomeria japonica]|nr:hypothetical protein SUGI_0543540 [Cryptomeria japonica]